MFKKFMINSSKFLVTNGRSGRKISNIPLKESGELKTTQISSLPQENKVIIIGAGLSGLSAADHLIKNGVKDLLILEAADRYGGRIHTVELGGAVCELGAKWINLNESPNSLYTLAKKSNLIDRDSFESNENFFIINKETMDDELVQLTCVLFRDLVKDAEKYLAEEVPLEYSTIDTYMKGRVAQILQKMPRSERKTAQQVFDVLIRNLSCQLGSDLGYVHVKHLGNLARHFDKPIFIKTGLKQIFNQLLRNIPIERLLLGKPIGSVHWSDLGSNDKQPYVTCLDGSKFTADHIICTIPLGALSVFAQHIFAPRLPETKIDAINKLGRGSPGKIYVEYAEPIAPWFIGSVMLGTSNERSKSQDNWTSGISEISVMADSKNVLELKVGGSYNETVERCSAELVERDITNTLRAVMRNNRIPRPSNLVRSFWSTDARSLCGLPFISIGSNETCVNDLAMPLAASRTSRTPRLLFAGDATSSEGFGTLEGARLSGIREAKRIIDFCR